MKIIDLFFCVGYSYSKKVLKEEDVLARDMGVITTALMFCLPSLLLFAEFYVRLSLDVSLVFNKYLFGVPPALLAYWLVNRHYNKSGSDERVKVVLSQWNKKKRSEKYLAVGIVLLFFLLVFAWAFF